MCDFVFWTATKVVIALVIYTISGNILGWFGNIYEPQHVISNNVAL